MTGRLAFQPFMALHGRGLPSMISMNIPSVFRYQVLWQRSHIRILPAVSRSISTSLPLYSTSERDNDLNRARIWAKESSVEKKIAMFPSSIGEVTFSRSSGPGGQNVNKLNTKATLRVPLKKLEPCIPKIFFEALQKKGSRYLKDNGDMVISADSTRSQASNTRACWEKLYDAVISSANIPRETSQEQKEHVKKLERISKERRMDIKQKLSSKKAARRGNAGEW